MNKVSAFTALAVIAVCMFQPLQSSAQSPQKMSYQAVIHDNQNYLVTNHDIGIQITILQGSPTGTVVYTETQKTTTNTNGLISIEIGGGTGFLSIDWSNGPYFLKTETDPTGGTNYTISGTSQFLSVPYAIYSKSAGSYNESDPVFSASPSNGITGSNITNWNTAFGWGSHAAAGYVNTTSNQTINGNKTFTGKTSVPVPVNSSDAATKAYVDALLTKIEYLEELQNVFTDPRDGNHYTVIRIDDQEWMGENLRYLPRVHSNSQFQANGADLLPGYGVYGYDGSDVATAKSQPNYTTYGVLYNWYAVNSACPSGWHVPSDAEWTSLTTYLGGVSVAGGKLKETGFTHWLSPNTGATNVSSFTALPGGDRKRVGTFENIGTLGKWWSSTDDFQGSPWYRGLDNSSDNVLRFDNDARDGFSVRCLKD